MIRADLLARITSGSDYAGQVLHVEDVPARAGRTVAWPEWVPALVVDRLAHQGILTPYAHQAEAAEHAYAGRHVVVATGTASGKSLAYQLPLLTAVVDDPATTTLYLAPTKALAHDQLRALRAYALAQVRAATFDGDTPEAERDWVRAHANVVLTNPDMLHRTMLPGHPKWSSFLRRLRYVVIDECHTYRGVFGAHVAHVLRRLRRVCAKYGAQPTFVLASATVSAPEESAGRLVGAEVTPIIDDAAPRGALRFALWETRLLDADTGTRRTATAETAGLLADLIIEGARTIAFVRSRRGAEVVATSARRLLDETAPALRSRVAAYRAGYLPEERRALEASLQTGELLGVAATSALELGVDIAGLDAVVIAGWPGTLASLWQQAGRAGRRGGDALAVLVARDDPLDGYLVHHPQAVFGRPVEATVFDPDNEYVLDPHLCAAAAELPLSDADWPLFGPTAPARAAELVRRGLLRHRPTGWYWARRDRASDLADIRGVGGPPVRVVETSTGRLLGTVDASAAHGTVHAGAVYLHQGESYVVDALDLADSVAAVSAADPDFTTNARDVTDIRVVETVRHQAWGEAALCFGTVQVTNQVVGFQRRRIIDGAVLADVALNLPPRTLTTRAVWYTAALDRLEAFGVAWADLPGAAHAAEHAGIGLLPLFATCDRWDIGGVSTSLHEDTGLPTVFMYDGYPGGAGFAERGYQAGPAHLRATREAIATCRCEAGCPSCVQSPKCGNGNEPLDKAAAVRLLDAVLTDAPA